MLTVLALIGCNEPAVVPTAAPVAPLIRDNPVIQPVRVLAFEDLPITDALYDKLGPTSTTSVKVDHTPYPIDFRPLMKVGDRGLGALFDLDGKPIDDTCNQLDFTSIFAVKGALWHMSHLECTPGAMYLSGLEQDPAGMLKITNTRPIDFSKEGGLWNPCAGQLTPWGTHLASEEYEPDAVEVPTSVESHGWDYLSYTRMQPAIPEGKTFNPYHYGWIPEVAVMSAAGDHLAVKHKAMGRASHEIAYVLPDERTVYLSDDGSGMGIYLFVADQKADLSKGTLYAMQFTQLAEDRGGKGSIRWIDLGHASDGEVDRWIAAGVSFSDMFERVLPKGLVCPQSYTYVEQDERAECLKLATASETFPEPARMASRLETRRYAAYMGATTEFEKGEGITFDPRRGVLYYAFARIGGRMVEEKGKTPEQDHIRLPENDCGSVWAGYTGKGQQSNIRKAIDSDYVITEFRAVVSGSAMEDDGKGNTCVLSGPANPDNITFLPDYDILMIAEDTKRHTLAALWALDTRTGGIKRVMVAPRHGEITGIHWVPDLNGKGYLTAVVQHPWAVESLDEGAKASLPEGITDEDLKSVAGYIGPFPSLTPPR